MSNKYKIEVRVGNGWQNSLTLPTIFAKNHKEAAEKYFETFGADKRAAIRITIENPIKEFRYIHPNTGYVEEI